MAQTRTARRRTAPSLYPYWFYLPAAVVYTVLFLVPTFASFYFSLTRWSLFDSATSSSGSKTLSCSSRNPLWCKGFSTPSGTR